MELTQEEKSNINTLIVSMFNASPGNYITSIEESFINSGKDYGALANALAQSPLFTSQFENISKEQQALKMMESFGLSNDGSSAGTTAYNYFLYHIENNVSYADMILNAAAYMIDDNARDTSFNNTAQLLENKTTVSMEFAERGVPFGDLASSILSTVTVDENSVSAAKAITQMIPQNGEGLTATMVDSLTSIIENVRAVMSETPDALPNLTTYLETIASQIATDAPTNLDAIISAVGTVTTSAIETPSLLDNPSTLATNTVDNPSSALTPPTEPIPAPSNDSNDTPADTTPPTTTITINAISADTGSINDFITKTATQTIAATLSHTLEAGEVLMASVDGGETWTNVTSGVSGTASSFTSTLHAGTSSIKMKVVDDANNSGTIATKAYTLDTTTPTWHWGSVTSSTITVESNEAGMVGIFNASSGAPISIVQIDAANTPTTITPTAQSSVLRAKLATYDVAFNTSFDYLDLGTTGNDTINATTAYNALFGFGGTNTFVLKAQDTTSALKLNIIADYKLDTDKIVYGDVVPGDSASVWTTGVSGWAITNGVATKNGATVSDFYTAFAATTHGAEGEVVAFVDGGNTYLFAEGTTTASTDDSAAMLVGVTAGALSVTGETVTLETDSNKTFTVTNTSGEITFGGTATGDTSISTNGSVTTFARQGVTDTTSDPFTKITLSAGQLLDATATQLSGKTVDGDGTLWVSDIESKLDADLSNMTTTLMAGVDLDTHHANLTFTGKLGDATVHLYALDTTGGIFDISANINAIGTNAKFIIDEHTTLKATTTQLDDIVSITTADGGGKIDTGLTFATHTSATLTEDAVLEWNWNASAHTLTLETTANATDNVTLTLTGITTVTEVNGVFTIA